MQMPRGSGRISNAQRYQRVFGARRLAEGENLKFNILWRIGGIPTVLMEGHVIVDS